MVVSSPPRPAKIAAHERLFWRRLAHWGAQRGPDWFVRYAPPAVGWCAAALVPSARLAVRRNLRRLRGDASVWRETRDVLATFANYASSLTEALGSERSNHSLPEVEVEGTEHVRRLMAERATDGKPKGIILVTAHTAGWDAVGPVLARDYGLELTLVMAAEPDARAGALHDRTRRSTGLRVAQATDALASLPLLRELRAGGAVALQLDRISPELRSRRVTFLGQKDHIPEGPLRLAQLTGAPIFPAFCARKGHRQYFVRAFRPLHVSRRADDTELDHVAQELADDMTEFLRAHPTDWFHFVP